MDPVVGQTYFGGAHDERRTVVAVEGGEVTLRMPISFVTEAMSLAEFQAWVGESSRQSELDAAADFKPLSA